MIRSFIWRKTCVGVVISFFSIDVTVTFITESLAKWFRRNFFHFLFKDSDGSNTILSNIDRTRTSFFEHRTNSNVFIYWWSNSNTLFLASNDRTSNFEPNRAFTRFTKLLFELTRTSLFRTSNELEHVHLLVIELEHPIFGFERSNIELRTLLDPSLTQIKWQNTCVHSDWRKIFLMKFAEAHNLLS